MIGVQRVAGQDGTVELIAAHILVKRKTLKIFRDKTNLRVYAVPEVCLCL